MAAANGVDNGRVGWRRGLPGWVMAAVGALALTLLPASAGQAVPVGSISGAVTNAATDPIADIFVYAMDPVGGGVVAVTWTDAAGSYTIPGLVIGSYRIDFDTSSVGYLYVAESYDNALSTADATPVTVGAGEAVTGIDATLDLAASISGTVADGFGHPPTGAEIRPARLDGAWSGGQIIQANGTFAVQGMSAGDWRLEFGGDIYLTEYYDNAATPGAATTVTLTPGQIRSDFAIVLEWNSGIAGTVTNQIGTAVAGVTVTASGAPGSRSTTTAADGSYDLPLPAGSYKVAFLPSDAYAKQYYDDAWASWAATPVTVVTDQLTGGIDAVLTPPLSFSDVVPGQPFYADIMWLAGEGITTGYPNGTFHPAESVSREAMAAFLHRFAYTVSNLAPPSSFSDVTLDNPFYADIMWLAMNGISTGFPDGTFHPSAPIARQAMAAFLYRFAGEPAFTAPAVSPFVDVHPGDAFYKEITWLADEGISTGTVTPGGTFFKPLDPVARQAMAAFLHRMKLNVFTD